MLGIGGSVQSSTEVHAHTEVETEKWGRTKQEMVLEDHVRIAYPGPILDADGRVVEAGNIWLIERPVATLHTITPITQHGLWDCAEIALDLENWTGKRPGSPLPDGEHWNVLKFAGLNDLAAFMRRDLVLRFKWSNRLRLSSEGQGRAAVAGERGQPARGAGGVGAYQRQRERVGAGAEHRDGGRLMSDDNGRRLPSMPNPADARLLRRGGYDGLSRASAVRHAVP